MFYVKEIHQKQQPLPGIACIPAFPQSFTIPPKAQQMTTASSPARCPSLTPGRQHLPIIPVHPRSADVDAGEVEKNPPVQTGWLI